MAMEFFVACAPETHLVIPGSGGFRKARWARRGKQKSSGYRVIYFFLAEPGRIYMADQKVLAKLAAQITITTKGKQ